MTGESISLYIHIPFCAKKCGYCDFVSYSGKESLMSDYTHALIEELRIVTEGRTFSTIFIGGGTPTHLPDGLFEELLSFIHTLPRTEDYEYTCEGNPESLTESKILIMKRYGVNRISMGLQTTDDILLKNIGRIHDYRTFLRAYETAGRYFENISFDLITALPGQRMENIVDTVRKAVALDPPHISVYSLILEEGTEFHRKVTEGTMLLPDEDEDRDFQKYVHDYLTESGYIKYEISNYARPGYECRHNINYWRCGEYIGAGVAAAGYENGVRYLNTSAISEYIRRIEEGKSAHEEENKVTESDSMAEFIFMGLRMTEGIDLMDFQKRFHKDFKEHYSAVLDRYLSSGHLEEEGTRIRFTQKGEDISNYILSDFV